MNDQEREEDVVGLPIRKFAGNVLPLTYYYRCGWS